MSLRLYLFLFQTTIMLWYVILHLSNIKLDSDVLDLNVCTKVLISILLNDVNISKFKDELSNFDWGCLIGR